MKIAALMVAVAALAGCANAANEAAYAEAKRSVPTCTAGPDCDAKWEAAQLWIVKNAGFKLQTVTPVVLQTFGPSSVTSESTWLAVTVTREPDGPGHYRIGARMGCGNPFGCTPEWQQALLDFARTLNAVNAAQP